MHDAALKFADAIRNAGLRAPEEIISGRLVRFSSNGKSGDKAAWYVFHDDDMPAGIFGDWRSGVVHQWKADVGRPLTDAEGKAMRAKLDKLRKAKEE